MDVVDALTGERRTILEQKASEVLVRGDGLLARMLDHDGLSVMGGAHKSPLGPRDLAEAVKLAKRLFKTRRKWIPADRLRQPDAPYNLMAIWQSLGPQVSVATSPTHEKYRSSYHWLTSSDDRTRTCDPVINSHLLYQLSYVGMKRADYVQQAP